MLAGIYSSYAFCIVQGLTEKWRKLRHLMTPAERQLVEIIARAGLRRLRERRSGDKLPTKQQREGERESRIIRPLFDRAAE